MQKEEQKWSCQATISSAIKTSSVVPEPKPRPGPLNIQANAPSSSTMNQGPSSTSSTSQSYRPPLFRRMRPDCSHIHTLPTGKQGNSEAHVSVKLGRRDRCKANSRNDVSISPEPPLKRRRITSNPRHYCIAPAKREISGAHVSPILGRRDRSGAKFSKTSSVSPQPPLLKRRKMNHDDSCSRPLSPAKQGNLARPRVNKSPTCEASKRDNNSVGSQPFSKEKEEMERQNFKRSSGDQQKIPERHRDRYYRGKNGRSCGYDRPKEQDRFK